MFQNILHIVFEVSNIKWIKESVKCTQFSKKMVCEAYSASHHFSLLFVFIDVCTLHTQTHTNNQLIKSNAKAFLCHSHSDLGSIFGFSVCLCVCFLCASFHLEKAIKTRDAIWTTQFVYLNWMDFAMQIQNAIKVRMKKWQQSAQPNSNGWNGMGTIKNELRIECYQFIIHIQILAIFTFSQAKVAYKTISILSRKDKFITQSWRKIGWQKNIHEKNRDTSRKKNDLKILKLIDKIW